MEQLSISQSCQNIIDKRKNERLPAISKKIQALASLKNALEELQKYQKRIKENHPSLIAIREKAPQVVDTIEHLDLSSLLGDNAQIAKLEKELNRLKKRFSREGVQIALVGEARKGKSSFLQSVTALEDDVIPTSSGNDCTGALSIIENSENEEFKIQIDYFSEKEFLNFFNRTLEDIVSSEEIESLKRITVSNIDDVKALKGELEKVIQVAEQQNKDLESLIRFYNEYYSNGLDYLSLLIGEQRTYYDKSKVAELVAKHTTLSTNDTRTNEGGLYSNYRREELENNFVMIFFNKYIAVKKAYIWTNYKFGDVGKIIMMDTVGLGNKQTGEKDEAAMYKVLREDTDAAIFNFGVDVDGMQTIPDRIIKQIDKIFNDLDDFSPERWISINANRYAYDDITDPRKRGIYKNIVVPGIIKVIQNGKFGRSKKQALHAGAVVNKDRDDVIKNMMIPVLNGIAKNVSDLDDVFMSKAEDMADKIYEQYNDICGLILKSFDKIITQSGTFYNTFVSNFDRLPLRKELNDYVDQLKRQRDSVCPHILDELKPQIDNLTDFVPSQEELINKLHGMSGGHVHTVYFEVLDDVTARIMSKLNEVSTQTIGEIQEKIKTDLAKILYKEGRLSELSLSIGKMNDDSGAIKWLDSFSREKLTKYPSLEKAVKSVLDFRMNIEGFIFAECIKACEKLRHSAVTFPDDNKPVKDKAYYIRDVIMRKVAEMKNELNKNLGLKKPHRGFEQATEVAEMAKPSLLMWCLADSFSKQFLDTNHGEDLKSFYSEYATIIWRNEFKLQEDISEATNEVNSLITILKSQNDRSLF